MFLIWKWKCVLRSISSQEKNVAQSIIVDKIQRGWAKRDTEVVVNYNISSLQLSKRMSHDVFLSNGTTRLVCNTLSQNRVFQGSVRLQNIRCEPFFSKVLKLTSLCFASFFSQVWCWPSFNGKSSKFSFLSERIGRFFYYRRFGT